MALFSWKDIPDLNLVFSCGTQPCFEGLKKLYNLKGFTQLGYVLLG